MGISKMKKVTEDEVNLLYDLFNKLSNSVVKDGFIQKEELQLALFKNSMKRSLFLDRMFDLFDVNHNGCIEFGEFVRSLSVFHPRTLDKDKMKCKQYHNLYLSPKFLDSSITCFAVNLKGILVN